MGLGLSGRIIPVREGEFRRINSPWKNFPREKSGETEEKIFHVEEGDFRCALKNNQKLNKNKSLFK